MYIGPWQEYKLAKILRAGGVAPSSRGSSLERTRLSNSTHNRCKQLSTPSTRSISSGVSLKNQFQGTLHSNFKEVQKTEGLVGKDLRDKLSKKPPVPVTKKRNPQNIHRNRIERMQTLYGLKAAPGTMFPPLIPKKEEIPEEAKEKEEVKLPLIHPKLSPVRQERRSEKPKSPRLEKTPQKQANSDLGKENCEVEEDIDEQADGLLKWVEELPEESSVYASTHKLPIAL